MKTKIAKLEELCKANRDSVCEDKEIMDTIVDSGLILYRLKTRLNACAVCHDYVSYQGEPYCLKRKEK